MEKRILIIDDDVRIVRMLKRRLKKMKLTVDVRHNGEEGLERAWEWHPDLVILDIHMPDMDGYTVVRTLRSRGYEGLVVACSASVTALDSEKTIDAGCNAFIRKPIGLNFEEQISSFIA